MSDQGENINRRYIDLKDITFFLNYSGSRCNLNSNMFYSEYPSKGRQREIVFENSYCKHKFALKNINESIVSQHSNRFNKVSTCPSHNLSYSNNFNTDFDKYPIRYENINVDKNAIKAQLAEPRVTFRSGDVESCGNLHERKNQKRFCSDKSTYCRPIVSFNKQQFIYKSMEKNAKLLRLVKELVIARQLEKDKENWSNYINELRKKHGSGKDMRRTASFAQPESINDYNNTQFMSNQSNPYQNLLQNFYNAHNITLSDQKVQTTKTTNECERTIPKCYVPFKTTTLCYPISSQGRLIKLQKEIQKQLEKREFSTMYNKTNKKDMLAAHIGCQKNYKIGQKYLDGRKSFSCLNNNRNTNNKLITFSTQTDSQLFSKSNEKNMISKEVCTEKPNKTDTLQEHSTQCYNDVSKENSLDSIEDKLDKLIQSINDFLVEIKTKRRSRHSNYLPAYLPRLSKLSKEALNFTRSDSCGIASRNKIAFRLVANNCPSTRSSNFNKIKHIENNLTKINDIIMKEIEKNKLITTKYSSVGEICHPCSVKISINIPTKEISTEVTSSLSKTGYNSGNRNIVIEEIGPRTHNEEHKLIAIAVNTDPFSLFSLLKASMEDTLRKVMSYVPSIDYYYYLSRLQCPKPRAIESYFVCNICGTAFKKPSQLTDHIRKHDLGHTRECSICRHMLDMHRRRPGLFTCQYCGQRFTRAYCCELHQQSCATRLGISHDNTSSLMLLR